MWCPSCRSEYRDHVSRCATCDVPLLEELPEATPPVEDEDALLESGQELLVIARADLSTGVEMKAVLAEARIPSVLVREPAETEEAQLVPRFHLVIPESRLEEAIGVLQSRWEELLDNEGLLAGDTSSAEVGGDALPCPACGHPLADDVVECPDCGLVVGPAE